MILLVGVFLLQRVVVGGLHVEAEPVVPLWLKLTTWFIVAFFFAVMAGREWWR